jgi:hypothetical protein
MAAKKRYRGFLTFAGATRVLGYVSGELLQEVKCEGVERFDIKCRGMPKL